MKIVDRLPYFTHRTEVATGSEKVRIRPYQIVVSVSIGPVGQLNWDSRTPAFPAILEPGNNHNFSIHDRQLQRWAGISPQLLPAAGAVREHGNRVPLHLATIWVHRNVRGARTLRGDT